eukprot:1338926-Pleurochrysis_carterae.AAC.2
MGYVLQSHVRALVVTDTVGRVMVRPHPKWRSLQELQRRCKQRERGTASRREGFGGSRDEAACADSCRCVVAWKDGLGPSARSSVMPACSPAFAHSRANTRLSPRRNEILNSHSHEFTLAHANLEALMRTHEHAAHTRTHRCACMHVIVNARGSTRTRRMADVCRSELDSTHISKMAHDASGLLALNFCSLSLSRARALARARARARALPLARARALPLARARALPLPLPRARALPLARAPTRALALALALALICALS